MISWKIVDSASSLDEAINESLHRDIIIFKHSTTCSISQMAKMRLEDTWDLHEIPAYYLDLKAYRSLSNAISEKLGVHHESPQLLLVRNKECIYDASHFDISVEEIKETISWHA